MTNPDDKAGGDRTPQGNAPSWVDEVLNAPAPAPRAAVPPVTPAVEPSWVDAVMDASQTAAASRTAPTWPEDLRIPDPAPRATPAATTAYAEDDWVSRATGTQAKDPAMPQGPYVAPLQARSEVDSLGDSARHAMQQLGSAVSSTDVGQKKIVAGLLGIVLGSLGVHKFYLGLTTPGLIMLGVNVGVWILAFLLGLLTLGVGLIVTIPLAGLVTGLIGLLGLVEGVIYLTKSDADFEREYVAGKKAWL
ncbi:NINE protein [Deinococcus sp.]|uniref:TM2 domain-containing protein n=1 Tax=Deinococcus sp. TaxID=47478 RepID=UPI002869E9DE|nr:NINE protein [Deinococcus sp.]